MLLTAAARAGGTVGLAAMGVCFRRRRDGAPPRPARDRRQGGGGLLVAAAVRAVASVAALLLVRGRGALPYAHSNSG
jgi:hypothetical protein